MKETVKISPHNKDAYNKVKIAFETSNRTCVIHPTGTGKMHIVLQLLDDNAHKECLYLTSQSPILVKLKEDMMECGVSSEHLTSALYAGLNEELCIKKYDYIIMDEFHRAGAKIWEAWVSTLLENNPQAKILGLSASPIRCLDDNRDMSDELFDGNVASQVSLAEAADWEQMFCCAQAYFEEYGNLLVPSGYQTADGKDLDQWVRTQRELLNANELSAEKQARLDSIGMTQNARDAEWEHMFGCAKDYLEEH